MNKKWWKAAGIRAIKTVCRRWIRMTVTPASP